MEQAHDQQAHDQITKPSDPDKANQSLTPHELVQHHMEHPDEPISDAEMESLHTDNNENASNGDEVTLTPEEKKNADELADAIESGGTGMSYEADI